MNHAQTSRDEPVAPAPKRPWYRKLGMQVLASLVLGIVAGLLFPKFGTQMKILGDVFLALIKAGVAPLVFLTIVHGIASAGDVKSAGRVGWRAIVYFEVVSTIALAFGLFAGNLLQTGQGMTSVAVGKVPVAAAKAAPQGFTEFVMHLVPDNFIGAFAKGELLQVVVLAVMVGIGILAIPEGRRTRINDGLDQISEVLFSFINLVMRLAPLGTFGAIAFAVGSNGTAVLVALAQLVLSFYAVVVLFIVVVMGIVAKLAGFSMWRFMRYIKDEILIVLGTASSESALPRLLTWLREADGRSRAADRLCVQSRRDVDLHGDGRDVHRARVQRAAHVRASDGDPAADAVDVERRRDGIGRIVRGVRGDGDIDGAAAGGGARADLWRLPLHVDGDRHVQYDRQQPGHGRRCEMVWYVRRDGRPAPPLPGTLSGNSACRCEARRWQPAARRFRRRESASARDPAQARRSVASMLGERAHRFYGCVVESMFSPDAAFDVAIHIDGTVRFSSRWRTTSWVTLNRSSSRFGSGGWVQISANRRCRRAAPPHIYVILRSPAYVVIRL
jgi:Sodium:dicarboxylate symporter family